MHPTFRALALTAACAPLTGCCAIALTMCDMKVGKAVRATADTPLGAVDHLIEAFRNRSPSDVYEALHPDYRNAVVKGGFSLNEFAAAHDHYRADFEADAEMLAGARRTGPVPIGPATVAVRLDAGDASVVLVFRNEPASRVFVDDPEFADPIRGTIPSVAEMVAVEGDGLVLARPVPLRGQGDFVDPAKIKRVELYQEWLLYDVQEPRNIRFVDRIREEMKGDRR